MRSQGLYSGPPQSPGDGGPPSGPRQTTPIQPSSILQQIQPKAVVQIHQRSLRSTPDRIRKRCQVGRAASDTSSGISDDGSSSTHSGSDSGIGKNFFKQSPDFEFESWQSGFSFSILDIHLLDFLVIELGIKSKNSLHLHSVAKSKLSFCVRNISSNEFTQSMELRKFTVMSHSFDKIS